MILLNNKRIDGVSLDTVPVGTISPFIGLVAPQGYLLCQGQKVSKNRYKQLYNICKSLFGPETETEFYLPDLRGRVIAGLNENDTAMNTIGKILGTYEHNHSTGNHTLTIDEIPSHTHGIYGALTGETKAITNYGNDWAVGTTREWNQSSNTNTGGGQAHNHGDTGLASNYQPTTVMNYIVKAEMVIPNQSTVYDGLDSDSEVDSLSARQGKILNKKFDNYLSLNGGTLTDTLHIATNKYFINDTSGINLHNSDIIGANAIYTNDLAENSGEGIRFFRDGNVWDDLTANSGKLYFKPGASISGGTLTESDRIVTKGMAVNLYPLRNEPCGNVYYEATHYMQLGYLQCHFDNGNGWQSCTVLVSSNFYGNQHFSAGFLNMNVSTNINCKWLSIVRSHSNEKLYYYADTTNSRLYIYAYVEGGNSFGNWNTVSLNANYCTWVQEFKWNVAAGTSWVAIG